MVRCGYPVRRAADIAGIPKKGTQDSIGITENTLRIPEGFREKVAKSCGDSIRILKKGVIGLHGDSKNKLSGFHLDYRKFVQGSIRIL